jgi:glycosyltransferase involved in cell wall biosynthesis
VSGPLPPPLSCRSGWPWVDTSAARKSTDAVGLPKITVVTPSYNQGRYLEATIRSVLLQGYPSLEYIVMDGGSTDESVSIIRRYEPWLTSWTSASDGGQSAAINEGFAKGTGEILAWLNSDDHYMPGALWTIVDFACAHPEGDVFAGGSERLDATGRRLAIVMPPGLTHAEMVRWPGHHLPQPSCFFRRRAWEKSGPLDETLYHLMDYDLWLRMSRVSTFLRIEQVLSRELIHEKAKGVALPAECLVSKWLIQLRYETHAVQAEMIATVREYQRLQHRAQEVASSRLYRWLRPLANWLFPRA